MNNKAEPNIKFIRLIYSYSISEPHRITYQFGFLNASLYKTVGESPCYTCEAQFKLNTTDQSKLVNALHLSAVERSDKVGCHSAKAAQEQAFL